MAVMRRTLVRFFTAGSTTSIFRMGDGANRATLAVSTRLTNARTGGSDGACRNAVSIPASTGSTCTSAGAAATSAKAEAARAPTSISAGYAARVDART